MFELSFGTLLFPYIIHMGLSSILQIFDSTEMEYSLCFLIKNKIKKNKQHIKLFLIERQHTPKLCYFWSVICYLSCASVVGCIVIKHLKTSGLSSHVFNVWGDFNPQLCSDSEVEVVYPGASANFPAPLLADLPQSYLCTTVLFIFGNLPLSIPNCWTSPRILRLPLAGIMHFHIQVYAVLWM